jgi:hypothetical protein
MRIAYLLTAVVCALPAVAQRYEFGVHGGMSLYDKKQSRTSSAAQPMPASALVGEWVSQSGTTCTSMSGARSATPI